MYDHDLLCQDNCMRSQAEEPSPQYLTFVKSIPKQPFTEPYGSSDASLTASCTATSLHGTPSESNDTSSKWSADAIYFQSDLGALNMAGLGWNLRPDNPAFDLDSTQGDSGSTVDCRGFASLEWPSMYSLSDFGDFESLLSVQEYAQHEIDGRLYGAISGHDPWSPLNPTSLMQTNHNEERSDSAGPFGRSSQAHKRAFEEAPPWPYTKETLQLFPPSSTSYLDFETNYQTPSMNSYTNDPLSYPCDGTAIDPKPCSHAAYQSSTDLPDDVNSKWLCPYTDCGLKFTNAADCKRHFNTFHNLDRQSYRCAHDGCVKAYKVWNRLDSFRKHAKLHDLTQSQMEALVQRSRNKEHNGLHVALTTQKALSKIGPNELGSHLTKSHILLSNRTDRKSVV